MLKVAWICSLALAAQCSGEELRLLEPDRSVQFPRAYAEGMAHPKWSGGKLLSWMSGQDISPTLFAYDRDGKEILRTRISFPEAYPIRIVDVTASPSGSLAAVGLAFGTSGTAGFLAQITASGQIERVVRTAPFYGRAVAFAPDQTIWVFGYQLGEEGRIARTSDHETVRHFGTDGGLIGAYLKWSTFGCSINSAPDRRYLPAAGPNGASEIFASDDRIAIFSINCGEWIELTTNGEVVRRQPVSSELVAGQSGVKEIIMRAAMTSSGAIYLSLTGKGVICRLEQDGTCRKVGRGSALPGHLIGNDGTALLIYCGAGTVNWQTVTD